LLTRVFHYQEENVIFRCTKVATTLGKKQDYLFNMWWFLWSGRKDVSVKAKKPMASPFSAEGETA